MRRILTAIGQERAERAMSITEGRQQGETARSTVRRPRSTISSSGHAPTRLGVRPRKAGSGPKSLQGSSSAVNHETLVFAVCRTGEPAPGRELRDRAIDLRFVQEDAN